jgi:hypothetical protein
MQHFHRALIALVVGLIASASALHAQTDNALTLMGGASQYDLSGTGTGPFAAVRYERRVRPALIAEAGVAYMTDRQEFRPREHHVFPEVMLQLQVPRGSLRPYLGAGAGLAFSWAGDASKTDLTLAGAGGLRLAVGSAWSVRAELRLRAVDPWVGTTADWGVGVTRFF